MKVGEHALLTVRGFSSHLQWDWVKSEGVWRRRFLTGTGSRLTRGGTEAFWTFSVFAGSLFSFCFNGRGAHEGLTEVVCIGILFWTFFNLRVPHQSNKQCKTTLLLRGENTNKVCFRKQIQMRMCSGLKFDKTEQTKIGQHEPVTHLWNSLWILFWLCWRRTGDESILTGRREESWGSKTNKT